MKYHILPGDALAGDFKKTEIDGELIVCRECLIDGDLRAENLEDFWNVRAQFIEISFSANNYFENVVAEFEKLCKLPENSEVNLWFEYDLFCQVNMWFCLSLLQNKKVKTYRVAPVVRNEANIWKGFGALEKEALETCFAERIEFSDEAVGLGAKLWKAFQNKDFDELKKLGEVKSTCFPKLAEVCQSAIEIENRPKETLRKITLSETNFENIFAQFSKTEGVYGFGDAQVRRMLDAETRPK